MVKMMKYLPVLLVTVLIMTEAKQLPRNRQSCSELIRGTICDEDNECACLDRGNSPPLICNYRWECMEKGFWDDIARKLPCRRIFKSACTVDAECPCMEAPLRCENNECVRAKFTDA